MDFFWHQQAILRLRQQPKQPDVCVRAWFFNHIGFCTINPLVLIASLSLKGSAFSLHFAISNCNSANGL